MSNGKQMNQLIRKGYISTLKEKAHLHSMCLQFISMTTKTPISVISIEVVVVVLFSYFLSLFQLRKSRVEMQRSEQAGHVWATKKNTRQSHVPIFLIT